MATKKAAAKKAAAPKKKAAAKKAAARKSSRAKSTAKADAKSLQFKWLYNATFCETLAEVIELNKKAEGRLRVRIKDVDSGNRLELQFKTEARANAIVAASEKLFTEE